ncbi:hypothetical protein K504DRAFT_367277 [Pleomassaria siparia CBS 279.74]|uniref:Uncharacterized protein n=1 Tax=Pleomassaria siparia CBS 279.74 TaxID=1314801 RepID=A0A6G1KQT4_9PLEO|nr:hypothetical protein K504DRAFT_367277 [Pleomassaria siparia CBS 279.74]
MSNRAATFPEGAHYSTLPLARRRSSILSEYSDTRQSFRSSTDSLLRPQDMDKLTASNEPTVWHSAPLAFAILPAAGGLLFKNGGAVVTDVLLLALASMFLNWCRDWYHAAQQVEYVVDETQLGDTILEEDEDEDSEGSPDEDAQSSSAPTKPNLSKTVVKNNLQDVTDAQKDARRQLAREEVMALIFCFLGPLLGAYLLHTIRSQLTRPAEGLVSDYNLTIFILAAELRPVAHVIKMKQERMIHLQRVVHQDFKDTLGRADAQQIFKKLADVEARLAQPTNNTDVETSKISATVRVALQPQLDALNRAVRRYEKRQAAQSIQIEARFAEVDSRLKDALSLAAAAARIGQRSSFVSMVVTWVANMAVYGIHTSWAICMYPFRVAAAMTAEVESWFIKPDRHPRKRIKGQSPSSLSTPRMQSRSGR